MERGGGGGLWEQCKRAGTLAGRHPKGCYTRASGAARRWSHAPWHGALRAFPRPKNRPPSPSGKAILADGGLGTVGHSPTPVGGSGPLWATLQLGEGGLLARANAIEGASS